MIDILPIVNIKNKNPDFVKELKALQKKGKGCCKYIRCSGWGGAKRNGTLGNFTINYAGYLCIDKDDINKWKFTGRMSFYDYWDFDPKPFNGK